MSGHTQKRLPVFVKNLGGQTIVANAGINGKFGDSGFEVNGKLIEAYKIYKIASWAPVAEASKNAGPLVWNVVENYLKTKKVVKPNTPQLVGVAANSGLGD